jgi:hypothetical protein
MANERIQDLDLDSDNEKEDSTESMSQEIINGDSPSMNKPKDPTWVNIATMVAVYLLCMQIYFVYRYRETINLLIGIGPIVLLLAVYIGIRRRIFYAPLVGAFYIFLDLIAGIYFIVSGTTIATIDLTPSIRTTVIRIVIIILLIRSGLWMRKNPKVPEVTEGGP